MANTDVLGNLKNVKGDNVQVVSSSKEQMAEARKIAKMGHTLEMAYLRRYGNDMPAKQLDGARQKAQDELDAMIDSKRYSIPEINEALKSKQYELQQAYKRAAAQQKAVLEERLTEIREKWDKEHQPDSTKMMRLTARLKSMDDDELRAEAGEYTLAPAGEGRAADPYYLESLLNEIKVRPELESTAMLLKHKMKQNGYQAPFIWTKEGSAIIVELMRYTDPDYGWFTVRHDSGQILKREIANLIGVFKDVQHLVGIRPPKKRPVPYEPETAALTL